MSNYFKSDNFNDDLTTLFKWVITNHDTDEKKDIDNDKDVVLNKISNNFIDYFLSPIFDKSLVSPNNNEVYPNNNGVSPNTTEVSNNRVSPNTKGFLKKETPIINSNDEEIKRIKENTFLSSCELGVIDLIKLIKFYGFDLSSSNYLSCCCLNKNYDVAYYMIENYNDYNIKDLEEALEISFEQNNLTFIKKVLLCDNFDKNLIRSENLFLSAVKSNDFDIIKLMIENLKNIDYHKNLKPAFNHACVVNNYSLVCFYLDYFKIDTRDPFFDSLLKSNFGSFPKKLKLDYNNEKIKELLRNAFSN